jgi:hypothetical protein
MAYPALAPVLQAGVNQLNEANQVLGIVANLIKILEGLIIGFGAFQLWTSRKERREAEVKERALARKAANYQAWQVINGAFGKGGSGGRVDALQDLVANQISLAGVRLDGAWLEGVSLSGAEMRQASLQKTKLLGADLSMVNFQRADLREADLSGANLRGCFLHQAQVAGAMLGTADLRHADLRELQGWEQIGSISYANIQGVLNAPPGFLEWALSHGAVDGEPIRPMEPETFSSEWRSLAGVHARSRHSIS